MLVGRAKSPPTDDTGDVAPVVITVLPWMFTDLMDVTHGRLQQTLESPLLPTALPDDSQVQPLKLVAGVKLVQ